MSQSLSEFSVVGQKKKPFRIVIESSDGKKSCSDFHEIHNGFSSLIVFDRSNVALGLMKHNVVILFDFGNPPSVHGNAVVKLVDDSSEFRNCFAVDLCSSFRNDFIAGSSAVDSAVCHIFVKSDHISELVPRLFLSLSNPKRLIFSLAQNSVFVKR